MHGPENKGLSGQCCFWPVDIVCSSFYLKWINLSVYSYAGYRVQYRVKSSPQFHLWPWLQVLMQQAYLSCISHSMNPSCPLTSVLYLNTFPCNWLQLFVAVSFSFNTSNKFPSTLFLLKVTTKIMITSFFHWSNAKKVLIIDYRNTNLRCWSHLATYIRHHKLHKQFQKQFESLAILSKYHLHYFVACSTTTNNPTANITGPACCRRRWWWWVARFDISSLNCSTTITTATYWLACTSLERKENTLYII